MNELKAKYEASMRDVLHILGKYDYQYIKEYVESLENRLSINIRCPYFDGNKRALCHKKEPNRDLCFECKQKWLDGEVEQ